MDADYNCEICCGKDFAECDCKSPGAIELSVLASLGKNPELFFLMEDRGFDPEFLFDVHLELFFQLVFALEYGDDLPDILAHSPVDLMRLEDLVANVERLVQITSERYRHGTMRDGGLHYARSCLYRIRASRCPVDKAEDKTEALEYIGTLIKEISSMKSDEEFKARFAKKISSMKKNLDT